MRQLFSTRKRRYTFLGIVTVIGVLLLLGAEMVATWRSPQVSFYNRGLELAQAGDLDNALKAFDLSVAAYNQDLQRNPLEKALLPAPSLEYAALAQKQRAIVFIMKQKPDQAILAFKASLKLNDGENFAVDYPLTPETRARVMRLREQAMVVKYDLELLFKKNPEKAKAEGKGQPQDGDGKGKPQPAPGNDPGKMPGKGNRDDI